MFTPQYTSVQYLNLLDGTPELSEIRIKVDNFFRNARQFDDTTNAAAAEILIEIVHCGNAQALKSFFAHIMDRSQPGRAFYILDKIIQQVKNKEPDLIKLALEFAIRYSTETPLKDREHISEDDFKAGNTREYLLIVAMLAYSKSFTIDKPELHNLIEQSKSIFFKDFYTQLILDADSTPSEPIRGKYESYKFANAVEQTATMNINSWFLELTLSKELDSFLEQYRGKELKVVSFGCGFSYEMVYLLKVATKYGFILNYKGFDNDQQRIEANNVFFDGKIKPPHKLEFSCKDASSVSEEFDLVLILHPNPRDTKNPFWNKLSTQIFYNAVKPQGRVLATYFFQNEANMFQANMTSSLRANPQAEVVTVKLNPDAHIRFIPPKNFAEGYGNDAYHPGLYITSLKPNKPEPGPNLIEQFRSLVQSLLSPPGRQQTPS